MANVFKKQLKIARLFFIISALYGLSLRLYKVVDFIPIAYKNILQAHSHVTFLGWGFLGIISIIGLVFYPKKINDSRYLKILFNSMATMLLGMLISFPLQGYKLFSIVFLSVFLLCSYLYIYAILKALKAEKSNSALFIKTGIYYYYLSSIAIWAVAIITSKYGKIDLYYNAVYFYLHFLYNGFFVFALFGLLLKYIELKAIKINNTNVHYFYVFTNLACIPAYTLSLLWNKMPTAIYYVAGIAAMLQIISLYYLFQLYKVYSKTLVSKQIKILSLVVFVSYFLKIILQFSSAFPIVIATSVAFKSFFIIGYLHLFTLGFMSLFIFLLLTLFPKIILNKIGLLLFVTGIFLSELLLFGNGMLLVFFKNGLVSIDWLLLITSALMPIGLLLIYFYSTNSSSE
ncbi:MAG: hypothetical protein V3U80_09735 [Flavobacteriaceae bacterium]